MTVKQLCIHLTEAQRNTRMGVRNFYLPATQSQLRDALAYANKVGDVFRAKCIAELLWEHIDAEASCDQREHGSNFYDRG